MAARILITEPIVDSVIENLQKDYTVDVGRRGQFNSVDALCEVIDRYDALMPMLSNPITAEVIEAGENLRIIANHAVGYNNIDIEAAKNANIHVANTPGVLTEACADLTWALLLSVARHLGPAEDFLRDDKFDGWDPLGFLGTELYGQTLGILGMGRIGTAVARRAKGFGLNIIYHNRTEVDAETEQRLNATYVPSPKKLAARSDILSLHCPLTDETHHLVDAEFIEQMPGHAILINTARGPVIDEQALAEALHEKRLAGAGLDVFEDEPKVHPSLLDAPNCVLTPHIGSATLQTRRAIGQKAADAIKGILNDRDPSTIPNLLTA
ncbi:MAG TPA: D-glycerate dehydrogenase [Balneolaceae bacterium]|nr:D-glycerate dehydrogenase [Balneolaceae bacterium]